MLNSSEHEKLRRSSKYKSPDLKDSKVRSADPPISFYYILDFTIKF